MSYEEDKGIDALTKEIDAMALSEDMQVELVDLIEAAQEEYYDYQELAKERGYKELTEEEYVRQILTSLCDDVREQARGILENAEEV